MSEVVASGVHTKVVAESQSTRLVVGSIVFNPIQISMPRDRAVRRSGTNVVTSERTVKELDTARFINGETPTPAADGITVLFTTAYPYIAGSLHVTRASLRMHPTADFSETSPSAGTFTMVIAPETSEPLIVDYVKA